MTCASSPSTSAVPRQVLVEGRARRRPGSSRSRSPGRSRIARRQPRRRPAGRPHRPRRAATRRSTPTRPSTTPLAGGARPRAAVGARSARTSPSRGSLEDGRAIGDRWRVGSAELVVTQPRLPCFKLGIRFGDPGMVKRFLASERSGYYLRVATEGTVEAGDPIELLSHEEPNVPASAVTRLYLRGRDDVEGLRRAVSGRLAARGLARGIRASGSTTARTGVAVVGLGGTSVRPTRSRVSAGRLWEIDQLRKRSGRRLGHDHPRHVEIPRSGRVGSYRPASRSASPAAIRSRAPGIRSRRSAIWRGSGSTSSSACESNERATVSSGTWSRSASWLRRTACSSSSVTLIRLTATLVAIHDTVQLRVRGAESRYQPPIQPLSRPSGSLSAGSPGRARRKSKSQPSSACRTCSR